MGDDAGVATAQEGGEIAGAGRQAAVGSAGARVKRRLKSARNSARKAWAASRVAMPRSRSSLTRRSCSVCQSARCGPWPAGSRRR